jgi:LysM repeat protein
MRLNPGWFLRFLRSAYYFLASAPSSDLAGHKTAWLLAATLLVVSCGQVVSGETPTVAPAAGATRAISLSTVPPRPTATLSVPTAAAPDTPTPSPAPVLHVVQPGETLIAIAIQYGVTVAALQSANGIDDPSSLQVNQELIIPTGEESQGDSLELLLPTPTPIPFAIEGVAFYETPVGSLWCLGEVVNSTESSLENVELRLGLYGAAGEELASGKMSAALDLIPPGERAPFGILFASPPVSFDQFRVLPVRAEASGEPANRYALLEFAETEAGLVGPLFEVKGSVANPGPAAVTAVMVVVTTYDAEGLVTGFRQARLPDDVLPGASVEFSVSLMPNGDQPAGYHVAVQGRLVAP